MIRPFHFVWVALVLAAWSAGAQYPARQQTAAPEYRAAEALARTDARTSATDGAALLRLSMYLSGSNLPGPPGEAHVLRSIDVTVPVVGMRAPYDVIAMGEGGEMPTEMDDERYIIWMTVGTCPTGDVFVRDRAEATYPDEGGGPAAVRTHTIDGSRTLTGEHGPDCPMPGLVQDLKQGTSSLTLGDFGSVGGEVEEIGRRDGRTTYGDNDGPIRRVYPIAPGVRSLTWLERPGTSHGSFIVDRLLTEMNVGQSVWSYEIPVDAVISWQLVVLQIPDEEPPRPHPCDDTEMRTGPTDARSELIRTAVAAGIGGDANASMVVIPTASPDGGFTTFGVPMRDGQALRNRACIVARTQPRGKEPGAKDLLVGSIQQVGEAIRVVARTVDVETGEVTNASKVDGSGSNNLGALVQQAVGALQ